MKTFTLVAVLALLASASAYHDLRLGRRQPGDHLLQQKQVDVEYKHFRIVDAMENFLGDGNSVITYIEAIDYKNKETSAHPTIVTGGVGDTHAVVKFESERGHGIHFIVKVYGIRK